MSLDGPQRHKCVLVLFHKIVAILFWFHLHRVIQPAARKNPKQVLGFIQSFLLNRIGSGKGWVTQLGFKKQQ